MWSSAQPHTSPMVSVALSGLKYFYSPPSPLQEVLVRHRVTYSLPSLDETLVLPGEQSRAQRHFNLE